MGIKAFVFDMDGTLLHTFPDLALAANEALEQLGFPTRTYDELLSLMGYGGKWLIEQAVPASASAEQRRCAFELWRTLYIQSDYANTAPYPGITDILHQLRAKGMKLAVLSNKFDEGTRYLANRHFPALFDIVRGDLPPAPRKPDPTALLEMLDTLRVSPAETVYVGDANVDTQTARNAGVMAVGVSWGYAKANPLAVDELDAYISKPAELLRLS